MGIHRINILLFAEYSSPADRRIRIETDIRLPRPGTFDELQGFLDQGNDAGARLLLQRVLDDVPKPRKRKGRPHGEHLRRVRKVVDAAFGPAPRRKRKV